MSVVDSGSSLLSYISLLLFFITPWTKLLSLLNITFRFLLSSILFFFNIKLTKMKREIIFLVNFIRPLSHTSTYHWKLEKQKRNKFLVAWICHTFLTLLAVKNIFHSFQFQFSFCHLFLFTLQQILYTTPPIQSNIFFLYILAVYKMK